MPIDNALTPYVPASLYNQNGTLTVSEATAAAVATGVQAEVSQLPPSQRGAFLALVNSEGPAALAPGGKVPADLSARIEKLGAAIERFSALAASGGNVMDFLARALIKQFGEQRHEAVVDRQTMRLAAQAELFSAAAELDKQAHQMMQGAVTALVLGVVSSAIQVGGAAAGGLMKVNALKNEFKAMRRQHAAEETLTTLKSAEKSGVKGLDGEIKQGTAELKQAERDFKKAEKTAAQGDMVSSLSQGLGQLIASGGHFAQSESDAQVKLSEGAQKIDEALAQGLDAQADLKKAVIEALDDTIRQVIAFLKDQREAKAEQLQAFTRV